MFKLFVAKKLNPVPVLGPGADPDPDLDHARLKSIRSDRLQIENTLPYVPMNTIGKTYPPPPPPSIVYRRAKNLKQELGCGGFCL